MGMEPSYLIRVEETWGSEPSVVYQMVPLPPVRVRAKGSRMGSPPEGTLEGFLLKDGDRAQVKVCHRPVPGGRSAATVYRTLQRRGGLSLVGCRLLTGRTHQIRAQMAHAGWPLLGDGKYGSERFNKQYGEKGQALYSYKLRFEFPTDAGLLNYLRGREFTVDKIDFAEKYFD